MQRELPSPSSLFREISGPLLKRPFYLSNPTERMRMQPDSSIDWLLSSRCRKLLFGRGAMELYKLQAGVKIPLWRKEFSIRITPSRITYTTGQSSDPVGVFQSIRLHHGNSIGYTRKVRLTNQSQSTVRLRMIAVHDPTSLNFRREGDPPAEIGVNAFNRDGHVVMDDAGDTTGVRIIGSSPHPTMTFMTKERQRVLELVSSGELPDKTEGMSGAIVIMTQHDFELSPRASTEVSLISLYHPSKLEDALIEYGHLSGLTSERQEDDYLVERSAILRSSSPSLNSSFAWAKAGLSSMRMEDDLLDSVSSSFARGVLAESDSFFVQSYEKDRSRQRRDGLLLHSQDAGAKGILETAHFIIYTSLHLLLRNDRKLTRRLYRSLKKAADALSRSLSDGLISSDPSLAQGWRRRLRSGFPSGALTEVNIVAARALREFASLAYSVGNGVDAARYRETSERILASINQKLRDPESGMLILGIDPSGRVHKEITIDQVVALSYLIPDLNTASSLVHRLLEKDFETGYGPRCVPSSNPIYYNTSYGEGQLGAYWTRAALAHAIVAYLSGYAGIGSMQLEKITRLVDSDSEKLGGVPGEFPFYLDPEKRLIMRDGTDQVAAARFVEAMLFGELGLTIRPGEALMLRPPKSSQLRWVSLHNIRLGAKEGGSAFVGRANGETTYLATTFPHPAAEATLVLKECERLLPPSQQSEALLFHTPYQLVCVGSSSSSPQTLVVSVPLRDKALGKALSAGLEELDQGAGRWRGVERIRLMEKTPVRVDLKPYGWKMLKFSSITS